MHEGAHKNCKKQKCFGFNFPWLFLFTSLYSTLSRTVYMSYKLLMIHVKIRLVVKFPKQVALLSLGRVNTPLLCENVDGFLISKKDALSDSLLTE